MFETSEELIEEVKEQALPELEECLDMIETSYTEYMENKSNKELKEIYNQSVIDLKTLLEEYCPDDREIVEESYEILFDELKSELKEQ